MELPKEFKHGLQALICPKRYNNPSQASILNDPNLSINTLRVWAEMDDPDGYKELITQYEGDHQSPQNYILYHVQHKLMYRSQWYQFKAHRWVQTTKEDVADLVKLYYSSFHSIPRVVQYQFEDVFDAIQLMCSSKGKVNIRSKLIAFDNGVYDLKHNVLRDGIPDDMITLCTNYKLPSKQVPTVVQRVQEFLQTANDQLLVTASSFLSGAKDLFIMTGDRHAKNKFLALCAYAFGDYYEQVDTAALMQKRSQGSDLLDEISTTAGKRFILVGPSPNKRLKVTKPDIMFLGKKYEHDGYASTMVDISSAEDLLQFRYGTIDARIANLSPCVTRLKPSDAEQFILMMLEQLKSPLPYTNLQHIDDYIDQNSSFRKWLLSKFEFTSNCINKITVEGLYTIYCQDNKLISRARFVKLMSLSNKEIRYISGARWYTGIKSIK